MQLNVANNLILTGKAAAIVTDPINADHRFFILKDGYDGVDCFAIAEYSPTFGNDSEDVLLRMHMIHPRTMTDALHYVSLGLRIEHRTAPERVVTVLV